ncbi:MAG TPA: O-antigen ligase family protein [Rhizomicrobium sp.]|jgi:O-antigen ligase|nr:O-antigen ligase family protein [Rhizomicrobium sp.]
MLVRALFVPILLIWALNLRWTLGVMEGNIIEKSLLILTGLAFILTRRLIVSNALLLALMAVVTFLMALLTHNPDFGWDRYSRGLVSLIAPFLFLIAEPTRRDRNFLLQAFAFLPILWLVIGLFYAARGMHNMWYEGRLQLSGIPSGLGGVSYLGVFCAMLCIALRYRGYVAVAAIDGIILLLSGARMPMGVTAIVAAVTYSFAIRRLTFMRMAVMAVVPAFGLVGLSLVSEKLFSRVASSALSGRDQIWAAMEQLHARYPLFGMGLGHSILSVPHAVTRDTGTVAAHNEYLRLAVECGDVGVVSIFGILVVMCFNIWRSPRVSYSPIFVAAVAGFLIYSATDNTISSGIAPLVIFIASAFFATRDEALPSSATDLTDWQAARAGPRESGLPG